MAVISRPGKEGNATTYQGKVAAGYKNILAQELDADIDAIFSAWNSGVDTVNIKPGSVTAACLAPGAVTGGSVAPGSITNAAMAANSVNSSNIIDGTIVGADVAAGTLTDSLIANVAWTKLIAPYAASISVTPAGAWNANSGSVDFAANIVGSPQYNSSEPSWILRVDYINDSFTVFRAPPPGTAFAALFVVYASGRASVNPLDNSITRAHLQVNSPNGSAVTQASPSNFSLATPNQWTNFVTMPSLTTRGGFVHLHANHNLTINGPSSGAVCQQRWVRDSTPLFVRSLNVSCTSAQQVVPLPGISWIDTSCPAGAHTYYYQLNLAAGLTVISSGVGDSWLMAAEVG